MRKNAKNRGQQMLKNTKRNEKAIKGRKMLKQAKTHNDKKG